MPISNLNRPKEIMKVRKQTARPCERKGVDNHLVQKSCELKAFCFKRQNKSSLHNVAFEICHKVEADLIESGLLRYELKESPGLEVLFDGIEKLQSLNDEILTSDDITEFELFALPQIESSNLEESTESFELEDGLKASRSKFRDNLLNSIPRYLGYSSSFAHEIFSLAPTNLFDSFFEKSFVRGDFDQVFEVGDDLGKDGIRRVLQADDLLSAAYCMKNEIEDKKHLKRVWPRYSEARFDNLKKKIAEIVNKNMPKQFKKFDGAWSRLSKPQEEAILLEYFYEEAEKPTQKENAKRLTIEVSSYQDRLEGAFKHFEKHYPEFKRIRRRKTPTKNTNENPPPPLYEIKDGKRYEIPHPKRKNKKLSSYQRMAISHWAYNNTEFFLREDMREQSELKEELKKEKILERAEELNFDE